MGLNKWTREALEHKAGIAWEEAGADHNEPPVQAAWERTALDCEAALKEDRLEGHQDAAEELENYLGTDAGQQRKEWSAINTDLARAGYLRRVDTRAEAHSVYIGAGRIRHITVDGVKYEAW